MQSLDSFDGVSSLTRSSSKSKGQLPKLLSSTNGLRKTATGETLADLVLSTSAKPKINYDKMKVRRAATRTIHAPGNVLVV